MVSSILRVPYVGMLSSEYYVRSKLRVDFMTDDGQTTQSKRGNGSGNLAETEFSL